MGVMNAYYMSVKVIRECNFSVTKKACIKSKVKLKLIISLCCPMQIPINGESVKLFERYNVAMMPLYRRPLLLEYLLAGRQLRAAFNYAYALDAKQNESGKIA
eukprot:scaffold111193_cov16-Prasinocladus_malaysianus.AAC.1